MQIPAPKIQPDNPDYSLALQEALDLPVLELLDQIGAAGWSKRHAFNALIEVAKSQALAYEEDPDPEDDGPRSSDSGDANDFGEFPSADGLVKAFIDGRDKGVPRP